MTMLEAQRVLYQRFLTDRLGCPSSLNAAGTSLAATSPSGLKVMIELTAPDNPEVISMAAFFNPPAGLTPTQTLRVLNHVNTTMRFVTAAHRTSVEGRPVVIDVEAVAAASATLPSTDTLALVVPRMLGALHRATVCYFEGCEFERLATTITVSEEQQ